MDVLNDDIQKFWKRLSEFNVEYIMVGGFAVFVNGHHRTTDDIDIWLKDTAENRTNFGKTMAVFGYHEIDFRTMQFVPGWVNFQIGNGLVLDVLIEMKGLESYSFDECLALAYKADFDGFKVPFLHINHLIENKKAVNRPKDQLDVIELEKILKIKKDLGL